DDGACLRLDTQYQLRVQGLRGLDISGGSRYVDVVTLHEKRNDDHEDDQQYEHHVHERRDVDLGLKIGTGIASIELHDVNLPVRPSASRLTQHRGTRTLRLRSWLPSLVGS